MNEYYISSYLTSKVFHGTVCLVCCCFLNCAMSVLLCECRWTVHRLCTLSCKCWGCWMSVWSACQVSQKFTQLLSDWPWIYTACDSAQLCPSTLFMTYPIYTPSALLHREEEVLWESSMGNGKNKSFCGKQTQDNIWNCIDVYTNYQFGQEIETGLYLGWYTWQCQNSLLNKLFSAHILYVLFNIVRICYQATVTFFYAQAMLQRKHWFYKPK